jgi:tRNA(fMet)-specific endonuclease VapC
VGAILILETSFLIDLERESGRQQEGAAHQFLAVREQDSFCLTTTIVGELACGRSMANRQRWEAFVGPFRVLPETLETCWEYGRAYRYLQDNGRLIGSNDLWIAATAIAYGMPLVTSNQRHFQRVPGLQIVPYR